MLSIQFSMISLKVPWCIVPKQLSSLLPSGVSQQNSCHVSHESKWRHSFIWRLWSHQDHCFLTRPLDLDNFIVMPPGDSSQSNYHGHFPVVSKSWSHESPGDLIVSHLLFHHKASVTVASEWNCQKTATQKKLPICYTCRLYEFLLTNHDTINFCILELAFCVCPLIYGHQCKLK